MRAGLFLVGLGLVVLWLAGWADQATPWLTWLTLLAGLAALTTALAEGTRGFYRAASVVLGVALGGLWLAGFVAHAHFWLTWWTFGLGVTSLFFALANTAVAPLRRFPGERHADLL